MREKVRLLDRWEGDLRVTGKPRSELAGAAARRGKEEKIGPAGHARWTVARREIVSRRKLRVVKPMRPREKPL